MRTVKNPDDRKEEIIAAASELFFNKGFEKATIDDIVKRLNISKGLAFYYFKTKDQLIDAVLNKLSSEVSGGAIEIINSDDDFYLKLYKTIKHFTEFANGFKGKFKSMIDRDRQQVLARFCDSIIYNIMPHLKTFTSFGIENGYIKNADGVNSMIIIMIGSISYIALNKDNPEFDYGAVLFSTVNTFETALGLGKGSITSFIFNI